MGNVDESEYVTTADWRIPITDLGKQQAKGEILCIDLVNMCYDEDAPYYFPLSQQLSYHNLTLLMNSIGIPQSTRNTEAGKRLRQKICEKDASVVFYHSPYLRTKQTLDEIMPFFNEDEVVSCLEEPRICEQQIGNFQNVQQVLGKQGSIYLGLFTSLNKTLTTAEYTSTTRQLSE